MSSIEKDSESPVDSVDGHIGGRIRRRRQDLRIDKFTFARMLGVTVTVIDQFETGERQIDPWTLFDISEALDVCVVEFFDDLESFVGVDSREVASREDARCKKSALGDAAQMRQWRMDRETIELVQAFMSISDPKTRRNFLYMTQDISRE
ncbi:MAG: helix-turn-helix transcriptional regulator [Rhodospirillaceae bacterium]|jgi:transcriptional regulator with XRE-family HTH domain|nr:helix-turn-helix transcriptional regulator [Rhodospirillaceae bacterium]MBT5665135.1 helix-turn-helix transcriptional regulator [Rhodospirillaceae bacterium]